LLPELLKDMDLQTEIHLWLMQNGALYFLLAVREFLNSVFLARWMGQGEPTAWSARSPDSDSFHSSLATSKDYCLYYGIQ
jgi:hypothetical protein